MVCSLQLLGFLELIVEYYRRCLIQIFGILEEYEVDTQRTLLGPLPEEKKPPGISQSESQSEEDRRSVREETPLLQEEEDKKVETRPKQASKYDRLPIKVEDMGEGWEEVEELWSKLSQANGFMSGLLTWRAGGGDSTSHILTHLDPPTGHFTPPHLLERLGEGERRWLEKEGTDDGETHAEDQLGKHLEGGGG